MSRTVRTFEATITNQQQVRDDRDQLGWAASKLWNVGRYYAQEQWDETGEIPDDGELKAELKGHERYTDLHSQSSQRVLEELAEAFKAGSASVGTVMTVPDRPATVKPRLPPTFNCVVQSGWLQARRTVHPCPSLERP